ncbi:aromatic acid exporter family protein [Streptococcus uberis]|uniref:aromatic acid exporter family protein n=1 Tax=Streptococcus uberis TaxID=1349 RepID=UPI0012B555F5|nr:aromatic acid exporter family protein [Streptococcus uberis]MTB56867.1 aromatic acid exporter family protein [Streptococcus uberis]
MPLVERSIKMVLATILSIVIADYLGLHFATSSGIIALLSILDTRQSSLQIAKNRLIAFVIAFLIAIVTFSILGYDILAFSIYLMLTIPLLYWKNLESGLVPITVLVTHLMLEKSVSLSIVTNEFVLFLVGTSLALLLNSYMTTNDHKIQKYHSLIEKELKAHLFLLEERLLLKHQDDLMDNVKLLENLLEEALALVYRESANQLFQQTDYQIHYFEMRRRQCHLLREMVKISQNIWESQRETVLLAHFIHETASQLSEKNSAKTLIDDIHLLLETYRQRELPKTRSEFENRAQLFKLLQTLEDFIREKTEFYQRYNP